MICEHADLQYIDPKGRGLECILNRSVYCDPFSGAPDRCPLLVCPREEWRSCAGALSVLFAALVESEELDRVVCTYTHAAFVPIHVTNHDLFTSLADETLGAGGWAP
jgi:hypothetical protein